MYSGCNVDNPPADAVSAIDEPVISAGPVVETVERDFLTALGPVGFSDESVTSRLEQIRNSGTLRVGMRIKPGVYVPDSTSPTGFHYVLVSHLARLIGVDISITVVDNISAYFAHDDAFDGSRLPIDVDLYADIITVLPEREKTVRFVPLIPVRQLLITRNGEELDSLSMLADRVVAMVEGSSYESQLLWHAGEFGFNPKRHNVGHTAEMVQAVADGFADVTLQDSILGFDILKTYPNLTLGRPVGELQFLGWGVGLSDGGMAGLLTSYIHHVREVGVWERLWIDAFGVGYIDYLQLIGM